MTTRPSTPRPLSRRALLGSVLAAGLLGGTTLTGCTAGETAPPAPDRLGPALEKLLAAEQALVARYDAAMAAYPDLVERFTRPRANHDQHVQALKKVLTARKSASAAPSAKPTKPVATPTPPASDSAESARKDLSADETKHVTTAADVCMLADGDVAALLGSISACHAVHAEVI